MWHLRSPLPTPPRAAPRRQRGGVAILVAVSLAMLLGFAGLVLDLGHLYVNKTELQNAADACALAAANELVCDTSAGPCPAAFLQNAEAAGIFVAGRNNTDFQKSAVAISAEEIRFHTALGPNNAYLSRAGGASTNSQYAMCTATVSGLAPWFIQVIRSVTTMSVTARAVATMAPGQTSCTAAPIGVCAKDTAAADFGFSTVGEWIVSEFNNGAGGEDSGLEGNFRWVDFTPSAGGTSEVRDQLLGTGTICGIKVGDEVREEGVKQGAKSAWNTRFGIYPNGANAIGPDTVPPDKTGYSYPSKAPGTVIPIGTSAYADYRSKQAAAAPFKTSEYAPTGAGGNVNGDPISSADHLLYGAERRLVSVPVIQCGSAPTPVKILGMGCALMLNPMSNGATGNIYLEWRGLAEAANSPCRSSGVAGGTTGPMVPTLVQ